MRRFFATLAITALLLTSSPLVALAQTPGPDGEDGSSGENVEQTVEHETSGDEVGAGEDGDSGGDGGGGGDGLNDGTDGESGDGGEDGEGDGEDGPTIPVSSDNQLGGTEGEEGDDGVEKGDGEAGDEEVEDVTGGQTETGTTTTSVITGDATAGANVWTDVNSNNIKSEIATGTSIGDLDTVTVSATGTNDTNLANEGDIKAITGVNTASTSDGLALIDTGDALAALNIANIVNTNVINSFGFITLLNKLVEAGKSLDLRKLFFPDPDATLEESGTCTLLVCYAEDVVYNTDQQNTGAITNDGKLEAITGSNEAVGDAAVINTGDAYAAANLMNVANTNIIDSNYLLLALNAMGTLDGDLILPTEDLFRAFFSKPNALAQTVQMEGADAVDITDNNFNNATSTNNLNTVADSGLNEATSTLDGINIKTGTATSSSNIINEINKNLFGGDSFYLMIRIHGGWSGNVYGLPEGLTWQRVPGGVLIYSEGAEIAPSQIVAVDVDSYEANFNNQNDIIIDNNLDILALSGDNAAVAPVGEINTGDAYAGANVMNVANTNVVGRNWLNASINIFGDFKGDISFGAADLWLGGQVAMSEIPAGPGTKLTYTYQVRNNGDINATGVELIQELQSAYSYFAAEGGAASGSTRTESLGSVSPGETVEVIFNAFVDEELPVGLTPIDAIATLSGNQADADMDDNMERLTLVAERQASVGDSDSPDSENDSGDDGNDGEGDGGDNSDSDSSSKPSPGGGGPSSSPSSSTGRVLGAKLNRDIDTINTEGKPKLEIEKKADYQDTESVAAGQVVEYTIIVTNNGGEAYNAKVVDKLVNPIGSVVNEQSWELGTIRGGERIKLTYEIVYDEGTPTGRYENSARLIAYEEENDSESEIHTIPAKHTLTIAGRDMAIGNVEVIGFYSNGYNTSAALLSWETTKPADGQVFLSQKGAVSPYNPLMPNLGYARSTILMPIPLTKHYMYITNLQNGATYTYRIRSSDGTHTALGGDYTFTVPGGNVSGVQVQSTQTAGTTSTQPSSSSPKPKVAAASVPKEPEPKKEEGSSTNNSTGSTTSRIGSFVGRVVSSVFGGLF